MDFAKAKPTFFRVLSFENIAFDGILHRGLSGANELIWFECFIEDTDNFFTSSER
jgi:hypothetical protein